MIHEYSRSSFFEFYVGNIKCETDKDSLNINSIEADVVGLKNGKACGSIISEEYELSPKSDEYPVRESAGTFTYQSPRSPDEEYWINLRLRFTESTLNAIGKLMMAATSVMIKLQLDRTREELSVTEDYIEGRIISRSFMFKSLTNEEL
jgi:hypothetical protein